MDLKTYYMSLGKPGREAFVKAVGTTEGYMIQLIYGFRRPGVEMAKKLADHSPLTLAQLRPDIWG